MASPVKIYGMLQSTCTQRVLLTCHELSIPYTLLSINMMAGEHATPSFIASHHPFGRLPALQDGEVHLFESRAICAYLLSRAASAPASGRSSPFKPSIASPPRDPVQLGRYEEASSVEYSYFDPSMKQLAYEKVFKGFMGKGEPDAEVVEGLTGTLLRALDWYETKLEGQDWLGGEEFSLLDLYHAPWLNFLPRLGMEEEVTKRKSVAAWWERIKARESWSKLQAEVAH
ncbi:Glutathione S-transferase-like protein 14 [Elsinoe fawcettii]|nr:Glutathione S-transferase-like protein 14 [Elsinoe fawcettii]